MHDFTPTSALFGGALIGLAASILLLANGRVAGVSGIFGGVVVPATDGGSWRLAFLVGLLAAGLLLSRAMPAGFGTSPRSLPLVALAGLLVGIGTRLGSGCTSGHGVCGLSRGSLRSLVATLTFMATGAAAAWAARALGGAS